MKKITFLLLFVVNFSFGQEQINYQGFDHSIHYPEITILLGSWKIDELITNALATEYNFSLQDTAIFDYGNNIKLDADQTFTSYYTAPCRQDCFTTTTGKYKILDENYICFFLEKITRFGICNGDEQPNEDLGLYYFYKTESGSINILRSGGSLEQDKRNAFYRDLIIKKKKEMSQFGAISASYNLLFNWKQTSFEDEKEIVAFCMNENQIEKYEILYSYKTGVNRFDIEHLNTILVKFGEKYRYIVYEMGSKSVGLYDDSEIMEKDSLVRNIDNDTKLKSKTLKETYDPLTSSSDKNTITVYQKKDEVRKIEHIEYDSRGGSIITTIYLQNKEPIYILRELRNTTYDQKGGYYIVDLKTYKIIQRIIKKNYSDFSFSKLIQKYNRIKEEINTQLK
jgi:hypothetical protein